MATTTPIELAPEVSRMLTEALEGVKAAIIQNMSSKRRNASGRSVRSLRVEVLGNIGYLWGSRSFMTMETGRKGGRVPKGFHKIIEQWIRDKGISVYATSTNPEANIRSAAYLIAKKIAREGTTLYRRGGNEDIYSKASLDAFSKLSENLLIRVGSDITKLNNLLPTD